MNDVIEELGVEMTALYLAKKFDMLSMGGQVTLDKWNGYVCGRVI